MKIGNTQSINLIKLVNSYLAIKLSQGFNISKTLLVLRHNINIF